MDWTWVGSGLVSGWTRMGVGLGSGWTRKGVGSPVVHITTLCSLRRMSLSSARFLACSIDRFDSGIMYSVLKLCHLLA